MKDLAMNRLRPYSEIIELTPWDFTDDTLLPRGIVRHCCDVHQRHLGHYYWNIFNRIQDQKVTYEIPLINFTIFDKEIRFLDERRLIFQAQLETLNRKMLQIKVDVFKSTYPFEQVATSTCLGAECRHDDPKDWVLGSFPDTPQVTEDLAKLMPEATQSIVENTQMIQNVLDYEGVLVGEAVTSHTMIEDYCEYGCMAAFMNYVTPIIEIARRNLCKELRKTNPDAVQALSQRRDYRNWKMWVSIKKAFFLSDEFEMKTSYITYQGRHYLKHELYLKRPKILKQVIIEEFK